MQIPDASAEEKPHKSAMISVFERLGLPLFLFGIVFLGMTIVVTVLLSPDRYPVRIGDRSVRLIDLESEQKELLSKKTDLESQSPSVTQSKAPVLHLLGLLRPRVQPVGALLRSVNEVRTRFQSGESDPIALPSVLLSASGTMLTIGGEVRSPDRSAMQLLASFVDGLRAIPLVSSVSEPEYSETRGSDGMLSSPFTLTLSLSHERF